jgi:outer membrane biosynthesis protein TonB
MKIYPIVTCGVLLASLVPTLAWSGHAARSQFVPPDIVSASDIPYPANTLAVGAVSLLINLDTNAQVQGTQVLRDFPSLTGVVQTAVRNWSFKPAFLKGNPVPSNISVSVIFNIFNPGGPGTQSLSLSPPQSPQSDASQYTPPQVISAAFALYPANSVSFGTVVLDVTVGQAGQTQKVQVIRGVPSLTPQAAAALKTWTFAPATVHGQPVAAPIIIAFVFQRGMS